jgi:ABC-type multidrug transport system permease subunit
MALPTPANVSRTGVRFRAILYFWIAALPVIIQTLHSLIHGTAHIGTGNMVLWFWAWMWCSAIYQGIIALRAFYDGTAERQSQQEQSVTPFSPPPPSEKGTLGKPDIEPVAVVMPAIEPKSPKL